MISALKRRVRSQLARWEINNCTPLWREAHFEVKMRKAPLPRNTFWRLRRRFAWQVQGIVHLVKVSKILGFCSMSKNDRRCGTFEEDLQRCISRGKRSTRDMFIRDAWRSGHWFPDRRCILEHQIFRFAKMILRDRCSTWDRWSGKIAKRIGTRPSALHSTVHFWRKSRRMQNASFLMLSTSNSGSLVELLRFWCCQVQKPRKSSRTTTTTTTTLRYATLHYTRLD